MRLTSKLILGLAVIVALIWIVAIYAAHVSYLNLRHAIAKETGALAEYFSVKGIPAAAVVKDGRIVWRGHPIRLTSELLDSWL